MNNFRIIEFKIWDYKQYEKFENVTFNFSEEIDCDSDFPFITLIIGANATGKSRLLRILVEVFNDLYKLKNEQSSFFSFKGGYKIVYKFKKSIFSIENNKYELIIYKNDRKITISKLNLPEKLIAQSYSINDRFPHQINNYSNLRISPTGSPLKSRYNNSMYEYLGIRTFNNMASATGHITRTIDILFNAFSSGNVNPSIPIVFETLNLIPVLSIEYRFKSYSSMIGNERFSEKYLRSFIDNLDEKKVGFSYRNFKELLNNPELLKDLVEYAEKLRERKNNRFPIVFNLDFTHYESFEVFISEYKMLDLLRKLNLVSYGEIMVYRKNGSSFDINRGSSGEINVFTSLISLACVIEDYSLILIDEPEISLHPNWQMKYLDLVYSIFHSRYTNTHFVICTHSHFLVSDLKSDSSYLLTLKNDENNNLLLNTIPKSTYGWTAEEVLYTVFDVRSTRNSFFEFDLNKLIKLINESSNDLDEIKRILDKFSTIKLSDEDPLNIIIEKGNKYIQENA
ncbi:AAA family ATPase [Flavobacterium ponti]|uniref:AAA family ATPase n=1 Tax=Flavobacterium ponti TaxID=665133 RepID=A0ABV9P3N8_9FLAO